jgi:uncharacterized protein YdiU (UPF0061 family)
MDHKKFEKMLKRFDDTLETPEAKAIIRKNLNKVKAQKLEQEKQFKIIEARLGLDNKEEKLTSLIKKLVAEHNLKYREKFYLKNTEPRANTQMTALFDYAEKHGVNINPSNSIFDGMKYKFLSYTFETIHGQGLSQVIYDKNNAVVFAI